MPVIPEQHQTDSSLFTGINPAMTSCGISHAPTSQRGEHGVVTDGKAVAPRMFLMVDPEATCVISRARWAHDFGARKVLRDVRKWDMLKRWMPSRASTDFIEQLDLIFDPYPWLHALAS